VIFKPWEIVMDPNETEIDLCPERAEGRCSRRAKLRSRTATGPETEPVAEDLDCDRVKGRRCRHAPVYYSKIREIWYGGEFGQRYAMRAKNLHGVLAAFEREGWPRQIDDPLPTAGAPPEAPSAPIGAGKPREASDSEQRGYGKRLSDTAVALNVIAEAHSIHYCTTAAGGQRKIRWDFIDPPRERGKRGKPPVR
jgi:hypothetical protein